MKKLLILALVALVAGAAFADTDPVFSGEFSAYWDLPAGAAAFDTDRSYDASIDLQATIDEFNTVSVSISTTDLDVYNDGTELVAKFKNDDGDEVTTGTLDVGWVIVSDYDREYTLDYTDVALVGTDINVADAAVGNDVGDVFPDAAKEADTTDDLLVLDAINVTSDVTGALGVDGPVGLTIEWGKVSLSSVSVGGYDAELSTVEDVGMVLAFEILEMLTLKTVLLPGQWGDPDVAEYGVTVEAAGIADMVDVAAYFLLSTDEFTSGDADKNIGASVSAAVMDGLTVGLGFDYFLGFDADGPVPADASVFGLGLEVGVAMIDGVAIDVMYETSDFSDFSANTKIGVDVGLTMVENLTANVGYEVDGLDDFAGNSSISLDATYALLDNLSVFGAVGLGGFSPFAAADITYDAGIATSLGALDVVIGASNQNDFKAPEDDFEWVAPYIAVSTSF